MAERDPSRGRRLRLLAIYTHPIQYYAPLFRCLAATDPDVDFEVLYLTRPTPEQQGQGFGVPFQWDQDLMNGYRSRVFRAPFPGDDYTRWGGLDAPGIGKAIDDLRPDVVLLPGWNCRGLVRALFACNRLGIPVLYRGDTNLWQRPRGLRGSLWGIKNRLLLRRFSGYLAVGKRARIFLREHGVRDELIFDSPHAVDAERIRRDARDAMTPAGRTRTRTELGLGERDFVVLFAGKLEPRKRPEDAVRAVSDLGPGALLAVCGAGPQEDACRKLAANTGARVRWLGFRNQKEMPRIYAAADVLVLPSLFSETWGLVVNEAMAVGTPCVVSDAVGCAPDLVDPGLTGEIYPATDIPFLVEGLERIRKLRHEDGALCGRVRVREQCYSLRAAALGIAHAVASAASGASRPRSRASNSSVLALCEGMAILGGMERRTMEILDYAAAGGASTHCIVDQRPVFRFRISHRAEQGGHSWSTARAIASLFGEPRSARWALQLLRDVLCCCSRLLRAAVSRKPRIIFLSSFGSALRHWPALVGLRWTGHTVLLRSGSAPARGARQRFIWKWLVDSVVDMHVGISDFIASEIAAVGISPRKIRVIRNPLPPRESGISTVRMDRRIVFVGQVLPEKGVQELIEALAALHRQNIPFTAILVGRFHGWEHPANAGYKDSVKDGIARLPAGTVEILGEREDVLAVMRTASIHCCPSQFRQREGLGTVVLEAKAAGIPSVVTPSGALPEMVRHKVDGWVCRDFSAEAIAEGLAYFLRDPAACRAAGSAAAAWHEPAYLRETVEREWKELLCPGEDARTTG